MASFALIIAFGILIARALTAILHRTGHSPNARLLRSLDVRSSGPDGTWTRRDHLRAAGIHAVTFAGCVGVALSIMGYADRWPNGSPLNLAFSYPGMVLFMLGLVFLWLTGRSLLRMLIGTRRVGAA